MIDKRRLILLITGMITVFQSAFCNKPVSSTTINDYTRYVNGFIGNANNGHTFPGACAPFGLIQASPESGNGSWRYCSGYNYDDDYIEGFAQTHLNGTGVPDLGDLLLYPFCGDNEGTSYKSRYDKATHKAVAGYYAVSLTDARVDVELTATHRTAFHRYRFNEKAPKIMIDFQRGLVGNNEKISRRVIDAEISIVDNKTITGYHHVTGWAERKFFYVIEFDHAFTVQKLKSENDNEKAGRYLFSFADAEAIQAKIAMSTVSVDGALKAMLHENPEWNFKQVKEKTQKEWNNLLSRVAITGTDEQKTNIYTSLYHLLVQPNDMTDTDGKYRGADDKIHTSPTGAYYTTLSLWDTYRAAHPLYTIITPERVDGMVQSMIDHYKVAGFLPIWSLWGKDNYCMIANHAIPVIVDAYLKGFSGFDAEEAYQAIRQSSTTNHIHSDWDIYDKYGYYPFDLVKVESASRTLESAYDDYCVAQMAKAFGKTEDYNYFARRAGYYKNLFDKETGFMRGKDSKGNWRSPFNPAQLSQAHSIGGDFTEGNSWQYTWHVQHDVEGLINLYGSKEAFVTKLDSLFFVNAHEGETGFVSDVTGLIGQYAHGNEPSHHVIYIYSHAGRRDRTQELVREVFDRFYKPMPDGLCGNDDCGQMSAWYVFSAMGFYPVNPAGGEYILGAPQIEKIVLNLPNGKTFTIEARGLSEKNKYVKSIELNGKEINGIAIQHEDIMNGGSLIFTMTDQPTI